MSVCGFKMNQEFCPWVGRKISWVGNLFVITFFPQKSHEGKCWRLHNFLESSCWLFKIKFKILLYVSIKPRSLHLWSIHLCAFLHYFTIVTKLNIQWTWKIYLAFVFYPLMYYQRSYLFHTDRDAIVIAALSAFIPSSEMPIMRLGEDHNHTDGDQFLSVLLTL